jgi:hypothetical protein
MLSIGRSTTLLNPEIERFVYGWSLTVCLPWALPDHRSQAIVS